MNYITQIYNKSVLSFNLEDVNYNNTFDFHVYVCKVLLHSFKEYYNVNYKFEMKIVYK